MDAHQFFSGDRVCPRLGKGFGLLLPRRHASRCWRRCTCRGGCAHTLTDTACGQLSFLSIFRLSFAGWPNNPFHLSVARRRMIVGHLGAVFRTTGHGSRLVNLERHGSVVVEVAWPMPRTWLQTGNVRDHGHRAVRHCHVHLQRLVRVVRVPCSHVVGWRCPCDPAHALRLMVGRLRPHCAQAVARANA